ncbi:MAG TPA: TetR/AcrR family transcriptional regulator [Solirubrobacterales bacterium]|nr:TetR/AcrR family transcriptional regulator [Solirubrobacterales bacterium]
MATTSNATPTSPPPTRGESTAPTGRGRRGTRASGDDRERAILETAERLLEERALSEISVDDLARGAGISRPTFYFYFPSKDAVVLTIIDRLVAAAAGSREEALATLAQGDPRAGLRQGLEDLYGAFRARRAVVMAAAQLRTTNEEARELWTEVMEGWVADVTAVIETERARGAAPPGQPARDLAIALVQMNERVQYATFAGESPSLADDRVLDVLVDIWLRVIYGTGDPA